MNKVSSLLKKLLLLPIKLCNKIILFAANIILFIYKIFFIPIKAIYIFFIKIFKKIFSLIKKQLYAAIEFYIKDKKRTIACLVVLAIAFKIASFYFKKVEPSSLEKGDKVSVLVRKVQSEKIEKIVNCYGNIASDDSIQYLSEVNGTINKVLVQKKSRVKKGQLLMIIDSKTLQEAYVGAKSFLEVKNMQYKAIKKLYKEGLESSGNLRAAKAEFENASSTFERIKKEYKGLNIYAPFDGYIDNIEYKEHSQVNIGTLLFTLEKIGTLKVECDLRSIYADELELGNSANILLGGLNIATGKITNVSENIDIFTGNKIVTISNIEINNGYEKIVKPGISVKIKIAIKSQKDLCRLSSEALWVADSGDFMVKVLNKENGEVLAKNVRIYDERDGYEYVYGLEEGDLVIERGHEFVKLGEKDVNYLIIGDKKKNNEEDKSLSKNNLDNKTNSYIAVVTNQLYSNSLELYSWCLEFYKRQFEEIKKIAKAKIISLINIIISYLEKK